MEKIEKSIQKLNLENNDQNEIIREILIDLRRDLGLEKVKEIGERIANDLGLEKYQTHWSNDAFKIINFTGDFDELMRYLTNVFSGTNVIVKSEEINFEATIG